MARERPAPLESGAMRLFVAVEVPREVKRAVGEAIEPWRPAFPDLLWVLPKSWHVTLTFLGPTAPRLLGWIEETVGAIASSHAPVEARIAGLGAFPSAGRARVLWAGMQDPSSRLATLVEDLEAGLSNELHVEVRRFQPHLTLARSKAPLKLPASFAGTPCEPQPFTIDHVVLYRSHLRRPAPRYEPLRTFSLEG